MMNHDEKEPFRQDLTRKEQYPGAVFVIHLLMKEPVTMPEKARMTQIMEKHLGKVDCFCHDGKMAGFAPQKYKVEFKDATLPPQLMVMECISTEGMTIDEITRSQFWDCPDGETILSECRYHVIATDLLGGAMDYRDRAEMLVDYIEALVELYPDCEAVFFQTSGKMFARKQLLECEIPKEDRFIYYAVNVRFFNIHETEDMLIDTLGMSTLYLPDLQYHFHGMSPNFVVNHAYNLLNYLFENDCPIKDGETVDGIEEGKMSMDVRWKCRYEDSLLQPPRPVLDINMGEYASGNRNE